MILKKAKELLFKYRVPCNKPIPSTRKNKKRMVRVCDGVNEKIIHYGSINHNSRTIRRRGIGKNCDKYNKFTADYWNCKDLWGRSGTKSSTPIYKKR